MSRIECKTCKHYKYCDIRKYINDGSGYLIFCPIRHLSNRKYFKKVEKHYLKRLEEQKFSQTTLEI